jgi:hypothetical protein
MPDPNKLDEAPASAAVPSILGRGLFSRFMRGDMASRADYLTLPITDPCQFELLARMAL